MDATAQEIWAERLLRLDTASVSDAIDSLGVGAGAGLPNLASRVPGARLAGPAFTVTYERFTTEKGQFHNAGTYIDQMPAGHVVLIDNHGQTDCTNWGNILTEMARLKGIAGTVVNGAARDIAEIRALGYPLFSAAVFMVSGKNRVRVTAVQQPVLVQGVLVNPGDWLFGDDNGVVAIPAAEIATVIARAEAVDATETRIRQAIRDGMALEEARRRFRYDRPWDAAA